MTTSFGLHGHPHDHEDDWDQPPPRIFFSLTEVLHLTASVLVLTVAFALVMGARKEALVLDVADLLTLLPYSAAIVVPAFIFHELAHKFVAQYKDMWAEFRANFIGLFGGLAATQLLGFLFAIPGAVNIVGHADRRDTGIISIVGPMVNLALGYAAILLHAIVPIKMPSAASLGDFWELVIILNAILAGFNMLPIGPLDGRKVWRWSILGFFGIWALVIALPLLYYAG